MDETERAEYPSVPFSLSTDLAPELETADATRIRKIAAGIKRGNLNKSSIDVFGPGVKQGYKPGPVLFYEDHRSIALSSPKASNHYQYRFLLLAGKQDILLIENKRSDKYEKYCRDVLKLPSPKILCVKSKEALSPLAKSCIESSKAMQKIVKIAKLNGCLNIMPYICTGWTWLLGQKIAELANVPVYIMAPTPWLAQKTNDKLWFSERLAECLGPCALPQTYYAFGPAALAIKITRLAKTHPKIVVKIPSSASSMGNVVIDTTHIKDISIPAVTEYIHSHIRFPRYHDMYPLAVSVWDTDVLTSPSLQIWIPLPEDGKPIIECLFEQALDPVSHTFIGARPAQLEKEIRNRLIYEAGIIAYLFQQLGYYGRCSIDAVVTGKRTEHDIHWIDCNARWGGVSIPMTAAQRLTINWKENLKIIVQSNMHQSANLNKDFLDSTTHLQYNAREREEGIVIMNPSYYNNFAYHDFMVFAKNSNSGDFIFQEADKISRHMLDRWRSFDQIA